jgi:LysR family transcriptional regulator, low CO2-responsive transcriptional regulator
MRLTHLRSFHAVAKAGGFTGGSKLLHISQPTVTTQVRFLEESYGIELFVRKGHSVKLTPLGDKLFALTQRIFAIEDEAIHFLRDAGDLKTGQLIISAVGPFHVTEMLTSFNKKFPDIKVKVQVGNSESVLNMVKNYDADIAVLAHFTDDPTFLSTPYSTNPIVLFVNKRHRFANKKTIKLNELNNEPMILREDGSTTRKAFDELCRKKKVHPKIMMEIGSREAIREAVIKGIGVSVVSEFEYIPDPEICKITFSDASIYTHAHVVCLKERKDARLVKAFLDIVSKLQIDNGSLP